MGRKKRARPTKPVVSTDSAESTVGLWHHPQLGAKVATERPAYTYSVDGLPIQPWTEIARLDAVVRGRWSFTLVPGQRLPAGFVWGDPSLQTFAISGAFLAYGPIERRCRACKEMYTWSARAQKHLYETIGVYVDKTARYCQRCARERRAREEARAAYAESLRALAAAPSGAAHAKVAADMLAILEHGGRVSIEKAIGHCTRARKLGDRSALGVEAALRARR